VTVVEVKPLTGRTSQIRAHAAWLGHPLVGDKVYHPDPRVYDAYHLHGDTPDVRALAGFPRHALHAASIRVTHPVTGEPFAASADPPSDMAVF
jgi:23S rRNA pseudouridine1911/1915/1917 synthase